MRGLDITYKDVIEPLESVSVNIIKTDKETLEELGPANEVLPLLRFFFFFCSTECNFTHLPFCLFP